MERIKLKTKRATCPTANSPSEIPLHNKIIVNINPKI